MKLEFIKANCRLDRVFLVSLLKSCELSEKAFEARK